MAMRSGLEMESGVVVMRKHIKLKMRAELSQSRRLVVCLLCLCLLIAMMGCANDAASPLDTDLSDEGPMPVEVVEEADSSAESNVSEREPEPKTYENFAEAYLDILAENSSDIERAKGFEIYGAGPVAILDVFGDETLELLYLYRYDDPDFFYDDDYAVPCLILKILSYSDSGGVETVFDSTVFFAAGGGNNYCVYLTREGELMLYRSDRSGGSYPWGFWRIAPNQNLDIMKEYYLYEKDVDLAKLFYIRFPNENDEEEIVYQSNGKEITKEQYDKIAKEIMEEIDYVIFPGLGEAELYHEDFWKDVTPFEESCMTYAEAVTWLEAQKESEG